MMEIGPPGTPRGTYDEKPMSHCETLMREVPGQNVFQRDIIIELDSEGNPHRVPVPVNVSITKFEIKSIKEVDHKFTADFWLVYEWFERRIIWHNLVGEDTSNEIPQRKFNHLFVPLLVFKNTNTLKRSLLDSEATLFGRKLGNISKPEIHELLELGLFPGTENPIVYSRHFFMEFSNNFDLRFYPFDTQTVTVPIGPTEPATLVIPRFIDYVGRKSMRRFTVIRWNIAQMLDGGVSQVVVSITIKRRVTQTILSTFVPSLFILILAQVHSLHINYNHFSGNNILQEGALQDEHSNGHYEHAGDVHAQQQGFLQAACDRLSQAY
jgi:hypothetical protein